MNRSAYYHTNKSCCLSFLNELLQHRHKYLSHISALLIWWKLWGRGLNILASIILFYFFEQNMNLYSITKLWCFDARSEPQAMAPTWTKTNKQTKRKTWCVWTEVRVSSHMSLSSSTHAAFRSIWNLARRLRWSEGNMSLGRPFIDHKTSSDRREREPISFKPSLTKPLAAEEKKEKKTTH